MVVTPLGERLLIKPIKEEKKTEGGIVLPDIIIDKGDVLAKFSE